LKITKEETASREVVLNIEVEEEDIAPYLSQAARRVGQRVRIPGFRQGKAPRSMVENVVGKEAIREEALDLLMGPKVREAMEQEGVEPYALPQVEMVEHDPVVLKAVTPVRPSVDLGDYKSVRVEPESKVVEDKEVDEVVERLRYDSAPWEPVDRPAKFGDLLTIDVDGWLENKRISQERSVDYVLRQDSTLPLKGFSVHLEGLGKEQEKEFDLTIPEDYPDPAMVGKECRFKVNVHEVKEKKLPELDDEFAKTLGEDYQTIDALRDRVREDLQRALDREEAQRVQQETVKKLLELAKVEYSPLLIEREVEYQWDRREQALKQNRMDMDMYLTQMGKTEDEMREELRASAEQDLNRSLVLGKVAEEEKLEVTDEEMEQELDAMAVRSPSNASSMRAVFSSPDGRRTVENMVLTRKVMERLQEIAQGKADGAEAAGVEEVASAEEEKEPEEEKKPEAEGGKTDGNEA